MTDSEKKLWSRLRDNRLGVKFRRQVPVGKYIADFICFEKKVVVEADGSYHINNAKDNIRDKWFENEGYKVLRFYNSEIDKKTDVVIEKIICEL